MSLSELWDRIDAETRQWLLDNPACVLVPNTITARIQETSDRQLDVDEHGQMILRREDLDFVREKGAGAGAAQISDDLRFFDANQPRQSN
ncbi:hypothetical protein ACX5I6_21080 [Arthrobacter sp. MMS24-T111]